MLSGKSYNFPWELKRESLIPYTFDNQTNLFIVCLFIIFLVVAITNTKTAKKKY